MRAGNSSVANAHGLWVPRARPRLGPGGSRSGSTARGSWDRANVRSRRPRIPAKSLCVPETRFGTVTCWFRDRPIPESR